MTRDGFLFSWGALTVACYDFFDKYTKATVESTSAINSVLAALSVIEIIITGVIIACFLYALLEKNWKTPY